MGKDAGHHHVTGCDCGRESSQSAYRRCLWLSRTDTGAMAASSWRARDGGDEKAFRILCSAAFCCSCSVCSRFCCLFYEISAPKSDLDVTHAWYS
jgi:hypothetical protein